MKKILFPTDLSDRADKALNFAQYIAINTGSELTLFHASMDKQELSKAAVHLQSMITELEQSEVRGAKTVRYDFLNEEGMPVSQLIEVMSKPKYKMLVMATTGSNRDQFQGLYLKSNTSRALEELHKSVLFYPLEAKVEKISKVLFTVDVMKYSKEQLLECQEFVKLFNAKMDFLYLYSSENIQIKEAINRFREFLAKAIPDAGFKTQQSSDVSTSINELVSQEGVDLLVMTKYKKQFWEKWFTKSTTQAMAYHSSVPVLVLSAE